MITKGQAYRSWEKWLDECPVDWYGGRHPTSEIETINFDFGKLILRLLIISNFS